MSSFITIRLPRCSTIQLNRYGMVPSVAVSSTLFFFLSIHILEKNHTALVRSLWPLYDDIWSIMIQIQVVSIPQFTQKMKRHFSRESTSKVEEAGGVVMAKPRPLLCGILPPTSRWTDGRPTNFW